ncbi:MAG: YjgP/YjgQ family permease [Bacteroidetes bacterium]|nr:YjgP/YjgQ family permease [Bacteroidota bacterium]
MKRLHKFILSSFLGPFVFTFFIVVFLLLMQFLWKYIDDLVGKGLEVHVITELLVYTAASLVPMAIPLAVLLASLMTLGSLGENYELTALKAAGISLQRIMQPLIVFSFVIALLAFFFANYVLPVTNLKMRSLLYDIQQQRPELQIREGVFYNGIQDYSIYIGKKDYKTNLLQNIKIYDHRERKGNISVTLADSGYMKITSDKKYLLLTLYNGFVYSDVKNQRPTIQNTYPFRRDKFSKQIIYIELSGFGLQRTDEQLFKQNYQMLNLGQLSFYSDSLYNDVNYRSGNLVKTLKSSTIFQNDPGKKKNSVPADSSIIGKHLTTNFDSAFAVQPTMERANNISAALSLARDSKSYIMSSFMNNDDTIRRARKYDIEWQRKFTLAIACIIFFFIGAPLGAIIRKGGLGMPVVVSVGFFVIYYMISISGEKFAREGVVTPFYGMWLSALILLPVGIFLTYKATTDSAILNMETYSNSIKRIRQFFKEKVRNKTAGS